MHHPGEDIREVNVAVEDVSKAFFCLGPRHANPDLCLLTSRVLEHRHLLSLDAPERGKLEEG